MIPCDGVSCDSDSFSQNVICSICGGRKSTCCLAKYYSSIPLRVLFVPLVRAYVVFITVVMSSISHMTTGISLANQCLKGLIWTLANMAERLNWFAMLRYSNNIVAFFTPTFTFKRGSIPPRCPLGSAILRGPFLLSLRPPPRGL
jgi:hypothetical protein